MDDLVWYWRVGFSLSGWTLNGQPCKLFGRSEDDFDRRVVVYTFGPVGLVFIGVRQVGRRARATRGF